MKPRHSKLIATPPVAIDVQKLCADNGLEIVNASAIQQWKPILRPAMNRANFELLGHFYSENFNLNIIGWGTTESNYMDRIAESQLVSILDRIFQARPPLVICSRGVNARNRQIILTQATNNRVPLVFIDTQLSFLMTTMGIYIAQYFAPEQFVHGSLVIINGLGVLITGNSGIGKSEAVLELIQRGHQFVCDDAVNIKRIGNEFIGYSPEITKDILEARGLGLIDIKAIYGDRAVRDRTKISLVVELKQPDSQHSVEFDRLGNENDYYLILGGKINKVSIPVRLGRNLASLIEVATNLFASKQGGTDALGIINQRQMDEVTNGK